MENIGTVIGSIVGLLGALGTAYAWVINRRDKNKDPIPKESAAVALSASAVALSQTLLKDLDARMTQMNGRNQILENRVAAAEQSIEHHERIFGAAMTYIEALLRHIRDGRKRPPPPVPTEIRDLIDPELSD